MTKILLSGNEYSVSPKAKSFLSSYVARVQKYVELKNIGIEYAQDIEMRIAERLEQLTSEATEGNAIQIVNELGEPEDIFSDIEKNKTHTTAADILKDQLKTPLYRDSSRGILFGVAAGLGNRWEIDPLYIRLVFLASSFVYGIGIWAYVILAVLMKNRPSETSGSQKNKNPEPTANSPKIELSEISSNVQSIFQGV